MPRRLTTWRCNWRGFAGSNVRECGARFSAPMAPSSAVKLARSLGHAFVHDKRLFAKDLDPNRPEYLRLCPKHAALWHEWHGQGYDEPEGKAAARIEADNDRQSTLFPDEPSGSSNLH